MGRDVGLDDVPDEDKVTNITFMDVQSWLTNGVPVQESCMCNRIKNHWLIVAQERIGEPVDLNI